MTEQETNYRTGFVAVVGRPNVGKSTLMNAFLQQKVAAVSPRPQTTRRRQLGILTLPEAQIIFIDTPGFHKPVHKMGEFMNEEALNSLGDADVIVFLVDASQDPTDEDRLMAARLAELQPGPPILLALNKIDLLKGDEVAPRQQVYLELLPHAHPLTFSALTGRGRERLLQRIIELLPPGPPLYDEEQVTDLYERDIAADLIREAALLHLRDEVPHGIMVRVDEFKERGETGAFIAATLFVERESQKGIVIGQGGEMLKNIGSTARKEIESMSGRKVFLDLRVKVQKNWRDNPDTLRQFGFVHPEDRK